MASQPQPEPRAAEQQAADQRPTDRRAAEQQTADQRAADRQAADQWAADKWAAKQQAANRRAAKQQAKRQAANRRAAKQQAKQQAANRRAAKQQAKQQAANRQAAKQRAAPWWTRWRRPATQRQTAQQLQIEQQANQPKAPKERAADQRPDWQRAAQQQTTQARIARRRAADQGSADYRANEKRGTQPRDGAERGAELGLADGQSPDVSMSHRLVNASNSAAAALEADEAYNNSIYELPFFKQQAQMEQEQYLVQMLTAAGRGLVDSFTELLNADDIWKRLADSESELGEELAKAPNPFRFRMEIAELLYQHIPQVLLTLGYHPPPPSERWTTLVQTSLRCLLRARDSGAKPDVNAAKARQELIFFTRRLRTLVETAEKNLNRNDENGEARFSASRHSLQIAVSAARKRAIPAALAAGVRTAVGGFAAGPAGMGIAFLSGGAASLLASATEAAATASIVEGKHGDVYLPSPASIIRADVEALDWCMELLRSATGVTIESIRFIIRRGVFQTLQDAAESAVPVQWFLWDWSHALLTQIDEQTFSADVAHQTVDRAREFLNRASNS